MKVLPNLESVMREASNSDVLKTIGYGFLMLLALIVCRGIVYALWKG
jgi:hypothetical protein